MNEKKAKEKIENIFKKYEEDIDEEAMKQDFLNFAKDVFEQGVQEKIKISGLIGDFDWEQFRAGLVLGFINCNNEKEFLTLFEKLINGIGTPKHLAKQREELGIHHFTEDELDQIEKLRNLKNGKNK